MPYCFVIWRRGSNCIDVAGLKPDDLIYLEKIPCLKERFEVDTEGFFRFGTTTSNKHNITCVKPAVVLTALEVLGFKVITATSSPTKGGNTIEYSWTLRREFTEPEPH